MYMIVLRMVFSVLLCFGGFLSASIAQNVASQCDGPVAEVNLDLWSTRSLASPDRQWKFSSVGPMSAYRKALLYVRRTGTAQQWNIGSLERDGTVFWSGDSKRLFLRNEYAADDTKIRVFALAGPAPKEIKGLDRNLQNLIFRHVPTNETTLWLTYPQVCFALHDSSKILLTANAPYAPKMGGSGKNLTLKLAVDLVTLKVRELSIEQER